MRFNPSHLSALALRNSRAAVLPLLKAGDSHVAVKTLQDKLKQWIWTSSTEECGWQNEKGCDTPSSIDGGGYFGAATLATVLAFQRSAGLDDDGKVGKKTWEALGLEGSNSRPGSSELGPAPKDSAPIPSVDSLKEVAKEGIKKGKAVISKDEIDKARVHFTKQPWFWPTVIVTAAVLAAGGILLTGKKGKGSKRRRAGTRPSHGNVMTGRRQWL